MTPTDLSPLRALVTEWLSYAAEQNEASHAALSAGEVAVCLERYRLSTEHASALARCLDTLGETDPEEPREQTVEVLKALLDLQNTPDCWCDYMFAVHSEACQAARVVSEKYRHLAEPAPAAEAQDGAYAPYWLAALRRAEDALANHAKWCGYKKDAPGDPSFWNAERALRNAIRRAESELGADAPAPPAPSVGTETPEAWKPIKNVPDNRLVLLANITGERINRVSDGKSTDIGLFSRNGQSCHWATHWAPMPPWWPNGVPVETTGIKIEVSREWVERMAAVEVGDCTTGQPEPLAPPAQEHPAEWSAEWADPTPCANFRGHIAAPSLCLHCGHRESAHTAKAVQP